MKVYIFLFVLIFISIPDVVFGGVIINEIMYDLKEGADTGREWVEVKNNGNESVDLSTWKLYENKTNHSLNLFQGGNALVASGGYAVIADNAEKFLVDWPNFEGVLFDSSFSLKQGGESLILRDETLNDIDQVSYLQEWGANGDGNSLQLVSGKWLPGLPSPGSLNNGDLGVAGPAEDPEASPQAPVDTTPLSFPVAPQIYAFASGDKVGVVGGIVNFEGVGLGLKKKPLLNARFLWNFGDGSSKEGKNVAHTYNYPGDYAVLLNVSSGEYSAISRADVKITEPKLNIPNIEVNSDGELIIEIHNDSLEETNISYWLLESGNIFFVFPKNSIIKANSKLTLPFSVTGLKIDRSKKVDFLYPNGSVFYSFDLNSDTIQDNPSGVYKANILSTNIIDLSKSKKLAPKGDVKEEVVSEPLPQDNYKPSSDVQESSVISFSSKDRESNKWIFFIAGFSLVSVLGVVLTRRFTDSL